MLTTSQQTVGKNQIVPFPDGESRALNPPPVLLHQRLKSVGGLTREPE